MAAAAATVALAPLEKALGLKLNAGDCEVQVFSKLSGDSTLTVTPLYLNFVLNAYVFTGNIGTLGLTLDTAAAFAITNTDSAPSVAISAMTTGANTVSGLVVLVGIKTPQHLT